MPANTPPPTSQIPWSQLVRKVDKDFDENDKRPVVYEFAGNTKTFKDHFPVYD